MIKNPIEIPPAKAGEINHEPPNEKRFVFFFSKILIDRYLPILPKTSHWILCEPLATRAKPTVAPTILWVPDTGKLKNVAINNQIQQPSIAKQKTTT